MSNLSDSNCKLENIIWIKLVSKLEIYKYKMNTDKQSTRMSDFILTHEV